MRNLLPTPLRYILVALSAYVFDIGVFAVLVSIAHVDLVIANVAGKICTAIFGFLAHRYFTFKAKSHRAIVSDALRFALIASLNVPFSTFLLYIVFHLLPHAILAKVVADSMGVGVTFILSRSFIFKSARHGCDRTAQSGPC